MAITKVREDDQQILHGNEKIDENDQNVLNGKQNAGRRIFVAAN